MGCIILVGKANLLEMNNANNWQAHDLTSGNHCVVKVGHSSAVLFILDDGPPWLGILIPQDHIVEEGTIFLPRFVLWNIIISSSQ